MKGETIEKGQKARIALLVRDICALYSACHA